MTAARPPAPRTGFGLMQDEELVSLANNGHAAASEFLVRKYRPLVENKARAYFVAGADRDDVIQEGMIGLCKAMRDFRIEKLRRFRPFAELCVTRQIISAVKCATRQKHGPLNGYVSFERMSNVDPSCALAPVPLRQNLVNAATPFHIGDPPESPRFQSSFKNRLSELEKDVLRRYLDGLTYREMSLELACPAKSIDNALQRVKRKLNGKPIASS